MPSSTTSRWGIKYGWAVGDNFKTEMDNNLKRLDWISCLSVKDRDLSTPPGSPATGDVYIIASSPTGDWSGLAKRITRWTGTSWEFIAPQTGMVVFIEDENKLTAYYSGAWSAGISI